MAGFQINHREIDNMVREIKKSFEQASRRHQIRVPVGADIPGGSGADEDPYLPKALLWLDGQASMQPGALQDMKEFAVGEGLPDEEASGLALQLEQHGFVQIARSLADDTDVYLTDEGRVEVRRLRKLAGDRVARANHSCDGLLRWLHDRDTPVEPGYFADSPTAYFAGTALTSREIATSVAELVRAGLAAEEVDQANADSYRLSITAAGADCVRSGHTVRSYMDSKSTGSTTNNYHGSSVVHGAVSGGVISTGHHNAINVGNGIDAQALAALVQGLRDAAPQLGLEPVDAEDYAVEVEALERDGSDAVQGGRIWRRITRLAGPAFTTALAAGAGEQLVELGSRLYS
ncbi:hypothetical protein ABUW04_29700 [Streptacidiphilus sp. N1-10]|uniref:Uncharacterized protein n=1 Tax=Streptacidiphilus jeojiensis TaxID=3229225 RepID=A0ABV6XVZ7_9ACTN